MLEFRDRISVAAWVAGLILALQSALISPAWEITWYPLGTPLTISLGSDFLVGGALFMALVGATQWILAAWDLPRPNIPLREGTWAQPLAMGWLAFRLLPHQPGPRARIIFLLSTLLLLALAWHTLARILAGVRAEYPVRFAWRTLVFATAGVLYLWLYGLRVRSLLSATQMLVGTYLLAAALWLDILHPARLRWLYSLIVAIVIAQLAWALRQTPLPSLRAGILLLLAFYLLTALVERGIQHRLNPRLVVEFAGTGIIALALVLLL